LITEFIDRRMGHAAAAITVRNTPDCMTAHRASSMSCQRRPSKLATL
jgi:hypothetical protein